MSARANAVQRVVAAKHARLGEPHVAELVALADEIAAARYLPRGALLEPYPVKVGDLDRDEVGGTGDLRRELPA
jgi:hypothetical protein